MMSEAARFHVLDVGQCMADHHAIHSMIIHNFSAEVDRAASVDEALHRMHTRPYDLVLVNRVMDQDGSDGLRLVREAKRDNRIESAPIMMVSNFTEAQDRAVEAGAQRGFGKRELHDPATLQRLARFLSGAVGMQPYEPSDRAS
jgi:CheY-like chemotaxis protein